MTDWLTLLGRVNIVYVNDKYQQEIYASTSPGIAGENGRYIYYTYQTTLLYGDLMAKLNKSWDDFSLNAAIGTSITLSLIHQCVEAGFENGFLVLSECLYDR